MRLINNENQPILVAFTDSGTPKTGLTVSVVMYKTSNGSTVTPQNNLLTEVGNGIYKFEAARLPAISDDVLVFRIDGSSSLGDKDRYKFGALMFGGYPQQLLDGQSDIENAVGAIGPVGSGTGTVVVNHDYGGVDSLRIVDQNGSGIENANIYAYLKADWDNGLRDSFYCKGWSMTGGDGRWAWSIYLNSETYYLAVDVPGFEQQNLKEVVVS